MLSSQLYSSIIEEEKKGLKDIVLRKAAINVGKTYSSKALKTGSTFLDYSKPQNRCAYLHKYAVVHTCLVTKFFRKLFKKKDINKILKKNKDIKISCLGGGPGTDIVGIFKALAVFPYMHQRMSEATILDLCVGWHHSFNYVIQNLISGKVKDVPETFVKDNFQSNFIEVNLLEPLPTHVMEFISRADIICMVKFVSAILGNKESLKSLKVLADLFKVGTVILFIDNFQGNVSESIQAISQEAGLKIVLGPEVEGFHTNSNSGKETFGCEPLRDARVTVIGLIKTKKAKININEPICLHSTTCEKEKNDNIWKTENGDLNEIQFVPNDSSAESPCKDLIRADQFTQTENNRITQTLYVGELNSLIDALSDLYSVVTKVNKLKESRCCCECHYPGSFHGLTSS